MTGPAGTTPHPLYERLLARLDDSGADYRLVEHVAEGRTEVVSRIRGHALGRADRTVDLGPGQAFTVPRGVPHFPRAPERTVLLMIEGAGVVPTGG